jgi:hypothetical protein
MEMLLTAHCGQYVHAVVYLTVILGRCSPVQVCTGGAELQSVDQNACDKSFCSF